jgi:cAMP-dependent protein kinase regulator
MLDSFKHLVGRKTKEEAQIAAYTRMLDQDPDNVNVRLKLGDLYAKKGEKKKAIKEYTTAAIQYAKDGYLVKAIAVNKIIVRLDPTRQEALDRLSELYFQRGITADPLVQSYRESKQQQEVQEDVEEPEKEQAELPVIETEETELVIDSDTQFALVASYIEKVALFANLSDETQRWLRRHVTVHHFAEAEVVLERESQQNSLFVVVDGNVKTLTKDTEGQDTLLDRLGTGAFFGDISLFEPVRQTQDESPENDITVIAETACTILEISRTDLTTLAKREPDVSETLLTEYYKRKTSDAVLARVPLFSYLDPAERHDIAERLTPMNVKKGDTVITEGEVGDTMYLIKSGEVGVYTTLMEEEGVSVIKTDQERLHLASLKEGDFFGEQALITKEPRTATVIALTDVQLLEFSKRDLAAVVKHYPRVGTLLKKYHQQRISNTLESLKSIW